MYTYCFLYIHIYNTVYFTYQVVLMHSTLVCFFTDLKNLRQNGWEKISAALYSGAILRISIYNHLLKKIINRFSFIPAYHLSANIYSHIVLVNGFTVINLGISAISSNKHIHVIYFLLVTPLHRTINLEIAMLISQGFIRSPLCTQL